MKFGLELQQQHLHNRDQYLNWTIINILPNSNVSIHGYTFENDGGHFVFENLLRPWLRSFYIPHWNVLIYLDIIILKNGLHRSLHKKLKQREITKNETTMACVDFGWILFTWTQPTLLLHQPNREYLNIMNYKRLSSYCKLWTSIDKFICILYIYWYYVWAYQCKQMKLSMAGKTIQQIAWYKNFFFINSRCFDLVKAEVDSRHTHTPIIQDCFTPQERRTAVQCQ